MRRNVLTLIGLFCALLEARSAHAIDALAERRQQVQSMSADEREELRAKFAKFEALSPDEQEQLRRLHEQLDSDPQGNQLRRTLARYHEWLKSLSPSDRADLLALPPTERLARIKTLKHDQEARAASLAGGARLVGRDVSALSHWMDQFAIDHESELLKSAPRRQEIKNLDSVARHKALVLLAWQHWRTGNKLPLITDAEITRLAEQLSPEPRRALEGQAIQAGRVQMIHEWAQAITRARFAAGLTGKGNALVSADDLSRFFQNELSQAERDRLMELPRDEMHRELRKLYLQHKHVPDAPAKKPPGEAQPSGT